MLQSLTDNIFFVSELSIVGEILPCTSPTIMEVRTSGWHFVFGFTDDLLDIGLGITVLPLGNHCFDFLPWDRSLDKNRNPLHMRQSRPPKGELFDRYRHGLARMRRRGRTPPYRGIGITRHDIDTIMKL